jgi:hypothetical protein
MSNETNVALGIGLQKLRDKADKACAACARKEICSRDDRFCDWGWFA